MIVVTGGAGFLGSSVIWALNQRGVENILVVDELSTKMKWKNLRSLRFMDFIHRRDFVEKLVSDGLSDNISAVIHMGGWADETDTDPITLIDHNFNYSKILAHYCLNRHIRLIYASTAGTYGDGSRGYEDRIEKLDDLRPLNLYAYARHLFDLWLKRQDVFDRVAGLKMANVFGPNEYHRGELSSLVYKSFQAAKNGTKVVLPKGLEHHPHIGQDLVYVKDFALVVDFFMENPEFNGLFNVGSGKTYHDVEIVEMTYKALGVKFDGKCIEWQDDHPWPYYYTKALDTAALREVDCLIAIDHFKDTVKECVRDYYAKDIYLGD